LEKRLRDTSAIGSGGNVQWRAALLSEITRLRKRLDTRPSEGESIERHRRRGAQTDLRLAVDVSTGRHQVLDPLLLADLAASDQKLAHLDGRALCIS
jgi:hypothetical protein